MAAATNVKRKWKVAVCELGHSRHFCRLCREQDTSHFSSDCPNSKTLYHGTQVEYLKSITNEGLKESESGTLGKGVYFVEHYDEAKNISRYRRKCDPKGVPNSVVIECQVHLGKHRNFDNNFNFDNNCYDTWQYNNFDSASRMHPPWCKHKKLFQRVLFERL